MSVDPGAEAARSAVLSRVSSSTDERLLEHFRGCDRCQKAGFYPSSQGIWPVRSGPGYDHGDGSRAWCAEGLRLKRSRDIARSMADRSKAAAVVGLARQLPYLPRLAWMLAVTAVETVRKGYWRHR